LGLLFWEIAWCKPDNPPFKDIPIEKLYLHLQNNHNERLLEMPREYRSWKFLINKMWKFKPEERYDIRTVELAISKFFKA